MNNTRSQFTVDLLGQLPLVSQEVLILIQRFLFRFQNLQPHALILGFGEAVRDPLVSAAAAMVFLVAFFPKLFDIVATPARAFDHLESAAPVGC
jgi:hypothetical protein